MYFCNRMKSFALISCFNGFFFSAAIMFLVFGNERNVYDQRFLEFAVRNKKPGVNVIRRTIQDLSVQGTLGKNKELLV